MTKYILNVLSEFREFAVKGNVVDMAIGVLIGTAFGKIVTSLVNDILMPPIGYILGGVNFSNLVFTIQAATDKIPAITINYGSFIQTVISFLITAVALFLVVKAINALKRIESSVVEEKSSSLLSEIRDLLKEQKNDK